MKLTSAVLLCTKNRTNEVDQFLKSLSAQTRKPDEVWVIDGAANPTVKSMTENYKGQLNRLEYITVNGDLTVARNLGVRSSKSDVAFFLDDDLILDPKFLEEILGVLESDQRKEIGGVCGNILGYKRRTGFRQLINRLLFLPADGNGRFKASGAATWIYGTENPTFVEFLPGGLTAYRRDVFQFGLFDEKLPKFGFTDDVDFSYRVSKRFKNFYNPRALAAHVRPPSERAMDVGVLTTWMWAYWRTFLKNRHTQFLGYFALLLLTVGFVARFFESWLSMFFKKKAHAL